jgi:hypothetical protein
MAYIIVGWLTFSINSFNVFEHKYVYFSNKNVDEKKKLANQ